MIFSSEKDFENHIRELLESEVAMPHCGFTILKGSGIADIIICRENPHQAVFFIEVKYAREADAIIVSKGIQSEVLFGNLPYINDHFMWLVGSNNHDGQYWLLDSSALTEFITGTNNISLNIFLHGGLTTEKLANRLRKWLHG